MTFTPDLRQIAFNRVVVFPSIFEGGLVTRPVPNEVFAALQPESRRPGLYPKTGGRDSPRFTSANLVPIPYAALRSDNERTIVTNIMRESAERYGNGFWTCLNTLMRTEGGGRITLGLPYTRLFSAGANSTAWGWHQWDAGAARRLGFTCSWAVRPNIQMPAATEMFTFLAYYAAIYGAAVAVNSDPRFVLYSFLLWQKGPAHFGNCLRAGNFQAAVAYGDQVWRESARPPRRGFEEQKADAQRLSVQGRFTSAQLPQAMMRHAAGGGRYTGALRSGRLR